MTLDLVPPLSRGVESLKGRDPCSRGS
ncbi:uncharacterized protein G2W53_022480 [Senna tora]|uniref:Uncharacterized protein n=1 Tax=Senna tora TaxID=362788 RepID=A0A834TNP6_9FABA|nr:uncharacterized protein G2W53_022480 [Senna tora]